LIGSEIKYTATKNHEILTRTTNHIDQIKNKSHDLLVNTSSGNHVLYIADYRPAQESDSQEHDTNQSHD